MTRERSLSGGDPAVCTEPLVETSECNTHSCSGLVQQIFQHPLVILGIAVVSLVVLGVVSFLTWRHVRQARQEREDETTAAGLQRQSVDAPARPGNMDKKEAMRISQTKK